MTSLSCLVIFFGVLVKGGRCDGPVSLLKQTNKQTNKQKNENLL